MFAATRIELVGGPEGITGTSLEVTSLDDKVKVPYASGYEHFAHSGEFVVINGDRRPVFTWCDRTRIAE